MKFVVAILALAACLVLAMAQEPAKEKRAAVYTGLGYGAYPYAAAGVPVGAYGGYPYGVGAYGAYPYGAYGGYPYYG